MFCIKSSNVNSTITLNESVIFPLKRLGVFEKNSASEVSELLRELDHNEYINITNSFSAKSGKFFPFVGPDKAFQKFLLLLRSQISRMEDELIERAQHNQEAMRNLFNDLQQSMGQAMLESGLHADLQPAVQPVQEPVIPYESQPVEYPPVEYQPMQYNALAQPYNDNADVEMAVDNVEMDAPDVEMDDVVLEAQHPHLPARDMNVLHQIGQQRDDINKLIASIAAADVENHAVMICGDISEDVFEIITIEIRPYKKIFGSEVQIHVETVQFRAYRNCNFRKGIDASTSDESNSLSDDMPDNSI